jgi:hypothetical protein
MQPRADLGKRPKRSGGRTNNRRKAGAAKEQVSNRQKRPWLTTQPKANGEGKGEVDGSSLDSSVQAEMTGVREIFLPPCPSRPLAVGKSHTTGRRSVAPSARARSSSAPTGTPSNVQSSTSRPRLQPLFHAHYQIEYEAAIMMEAT